jgi:hypothetical protein
MIVEQNHLWGWGVSGVHHRFSGFAQSMMPVSYIPIMNQHGLDQVCPWSLPNDSIEHRQDLDTGFP